MQEEEKGIWTALDLLTSAEYTIGIVAAKTKDEKIFQDLEKARKKIKEVEVIITPLRKL